MNRRGSIVALAALASGLIAAVTWRAVHTRRATAPARAPQVALLTPVAAAGAPAEMEAPFALPEEPAPPARGTAAHQVYFQAMVEGDERALALARQALATAPAGNLTPGYAERMRAMERTYAEKLARHREELDHSRP